jgi:epoxyqueuosine reductase
VTPAETAQLIVDEARELGFHRVGIASVDTPVRYREYRQWLAAGHAGSMAYLSAAHQLEARRNLRALAEGARTAVVVALAYAKSGGDETGGGPRGFVARYARGADYHSVVWGKLTALADELSRRLGRPVAARPCVDSAPVLERDLAEAAGLGFAAKNTMLIAPGLGSYFVLGELLLDVDAEPTPALDRSAPRCGDCRACLDACPTDAFTAPHSLDARRCVSYLTIENGGVIDRALRPAIGTMVFGCDVCQQVCPYNAAAPDRAEPSPELAPRRPDSGALDLVRLLGLGANQLRKLVDGTAMRRANRTQLMRNACVALGNSGDELAVPALARALRDRNPIVRGHAAWGLGALGAFNELEAASATEDDVYVRSEITAALAARRRGATSARE